MGFRDGFEYLRNERTIVLGLETNLLGTSPLLGSDGGTLCGCRYYFDELGEQGLHPVGELRGSAQQRV